MTIVNRFSTNHVCVKGNSSLSLWKEGSFLWKSGNRIHIFRGYAVPLSLYLDQIAALLNVIPKVIASHAGVCSLATSRRYGTPGNIYKDERISKIWLQPLFYNIQNLWYLFKKFRQMRWKVVPQHGSSPRPTDC